MVVANIKAAAQKELGEKLYQILQEKGIETLLDDRTERAGVKFKDADLIGIPWRVVIGRNAESGEVELINRSSKQTRLLSSEEAAEELIKEVLTQKN